MTSSNPPIRVRFAPSPTGFLHMGGARTALYNWLWARKVGGSFLLRIEDTDAERSTLPMVQGILDGLEWLGLVTDEEPVFQSAGVERHRALAHRLLESGHAYRCFASQQELEVERAEARSAKRNFRYVQRYRDLSAEESAAKAAAGEAFVLRFLVPEQGEIGFSDQVFGEQRRSFADIEDFALLRGDGSPLYNLSVSSDDAEMAISHVIRGADHIPNTFKQVLVYEAAGLPVPQFAHLPLILAPGRKKLSKRTHGETVAVTTYRDRGFLPEAFLNYLLLLGFTPSDDREVLRADEMIEDFSLDRIHKTNAIFNFSEAEAKAWTDQKALWMNGQWISGMAMDELLPRVAARLEAAGLWQSEWSSGDGASWFAACVDAIRQRFFSLDDFAGLGRAFFSDDFAIVGKAIKNLGKDGLDEHLPALADAFAALEEWTLESTETCLRAVAEARGAKAGLLINASRAATTGQPVGPGAFDVLVLVGQTRTVERLRGALAKVAAQD